MARCTAQSKQHHRQCLQAAMKGKRVCQHHGGKSLVGLLAPAYKDGRYSTHLPTQMARAYALSRTDPELCSTRDEIALVECRLKELLHGLQDAPGADEAQVWRGVNRQIDRLARLRLAEHTRTMDLHLVITQDQANVLLGALVGIVLEVTRRHATDEQHARRMFSDMSRELEACVQLGMAPGAEA